MLEVKYACGEDRHGRLGCGFRETVQLALETTRLCVGAQPRGT